MARPRRSNLYRQSSNARRKRNVVNERTEKEKEIAREERRVRMARFRAFQSKEQSEVARESARLAMRNRRANNREKQVDNFRRTRKDLSSADLNRAAFQYDCSTDYCLHPSVCVGFKLQVTELVRHFVKITALTGEDYLMDCKGFFISGIFKNYFVSHAFSVTPPLMDFEDELTWSDLLLYKSPTVIFDNSNFIEAITRKLFEQAFKQPLCLHDQQIVLEKILNHHCFIHQIGFTPSKLPLLVENNPLISFEILVRLINSKDITKYLSILVNMDITLHSMEVVNRLTNSVDLPTEFIHLYISNCITTCETVKDKYMQSRLVRLVCVFLQSLIRNKIINVKDLFIEIEAFCVGFSRIKEAVGLYRLLKHIEMGESFQQTSILSNPTNIFKSEKSSNGK